MSEKLIKITSFHCDRCGHNWIRNKYNFHHKNKPQICPKCKSKKWDSTIDLCSVCGKKNVYGKFGICRDCQSAYKRLYNLVNIQAKYQKHDYPILYENRLENGVLTQVAENKFTNRNRQKLFSILGNKCYICEISSNEKKVCLHHISYLNLNRKDIKEYANFIIPLCINHHVKLHCITNQLLKKQGILDEKYY